MRKKTIHRYFGYALYLHSKAENWYLKTSINEFRKDFANWNLKYIQSLTKMWDLFVCLLPDCEAVNCLLQGLWRVRSGFWNALCYVTLWSLCVSYHVGPPFSVSGSWASTVTSTSVSTNCTTASSRHSTPSSRVSLSGSSVSSSSSCQCLSQEGPGATALNGRGTTAL